MRSEKRKRYCQLPSRGSIAGRSSSITNAFFNAIIPIDEPTEAEELRALEILGIEPTDIRCAYCGDKSSEWDHLRPIITDQKPTGFITEIANLVPACGKCNQSKGKRHWREWMESSAKLSPTTRGIPDIQSRIEKLTEYAMWKPPTRVNFESIVDAELWSNHHGNWRKVLDLLKESQSLASQIRQAIANAPVHRSEATGQRTIGAAIHPTGPKLMRDGEKTLEHDEVFRRLNEMLDEKYG